MRLPKGSQYVAASAIGRQDDNVIVMTNKGKPLYMRIGRAENIKRGRNGGDILLTLGDDEFVTGVISYQPKVVPPEPVENDDGFDEEESEE